MHSSTNGLLSVEPLSAPPCRRSGPALLASTPSERPGEEASSHLPAEPVIRLEHLCVEYGSSHRAVADLNLTVRAGEVFGFLGPNGAGKTSTMNVLLGFTPATSGNAYLFETNVRDPIARQRIGYLPELTYYYKFLSAEELLAFYGRIFGLAKRDLQNRIDEALELVELSSARKRLIKTYSKGMQQRVGLAQALINDPDLLILDEPTSGLDPLGRMKVREIIQRLKARGKTVFFSSHELGEVETVCDRVGILHRGKLQVEGSLEELQGRYECNLEQLFLRVVGYGAPSREPQS